MIRVDDIVADLDLGAPQPFQILRSSGQWALGGFQSTTTTLAQLGPVQRATDKEVQMLPEGDRVGGVMAFWCTVPIYTTRGRLDNPSASVQIPRGSGSTFTITGATDGTFYVNGLIQVPDVDYTLSNGVITTTLPVPGGSTLLFIGVVTNSSDSPAAADILVYPPNGEQYRVLSVRHYPGSGFWKALGTRMSSV